MTLNLFRYISIKKIIFWKLEFQKLIIEYSIKASGKTIIKGLKIPT